jgi:hypothetical protein
MLLAAKH